MSPNLVRPGLLALLRAVPLIALLAVPVRNAAAQRVSRAEQPRPVIVVSASAEVEVAPDRAHLSVAVQSRGRTAAEAASANALSQGAVVEAVRRAGVPAAQLQTTALSVSPEYEYPREGGRPTVVGYQATNSVEIEIRELAVIGAVLDAVLAAGATTVAGPHFALANASVPRRAALELAVKQARADAEAIAEAAGVTLGSVLELVSDASGEGAPRPELSRGQMPASISADAGTPVESGRITVRASVSARYAIRQ